MKTPIPWNELVDLLETEIQQYDGLKDLIETESRLLMQPDLSAYNQLLSEKQARVDALQRKDKARADWLRRFGFANPAQPLKSIIAQAPRETGHRLERCRQELKALARSLETGNRLNRKMLNHSRGLAENTLRLLGNQLYLRPTYQPNGNLSGAGEGGFILSGMA